MNEIASRYGLALFELAKENNSIGEFQNEVKELVEILENNIEFLDILVSRFVSLKEKHSILDNTFSNMSKDIVSLLKVILNNDRANILLDCLYSFNSFCNDYFNIKEGIIYSAFDLSKEQIIKIEDAISKKENKKIQLFLKIDPTLIGGVKIVIQDHVYDGSIKNKLENLKHTLLKKEAES